tara:strand:- start:1167 stop:2678 length:1512 start_codon:yes stop_codon:yes gene_type:complete
MPTPSSRTPVKLGRGSYSDLNGSISDLQEGEIVYAQDQDACYVKEGSSLVKLKSDVADAQITTAKIADDAVTLAKMAGLARGKIIYGDSSGDPAVLAPGSANQVLTSDGTDISWAAASGGGGGGGASTGELYVNATDSTNTAANDGTNLKCGSNSGANLASGAEKNILIGVEAGNDITNADECVALGHNSLTKNVNSSGLTAIGANAGENYSAINGTFLGYKAGRYLTDGSGNTCIGVQAGQATGIYAGGAGTYLNTYIGYQAGVSTTGGNHVVGIGYNCLAQNGAWSNSAVGNDSLTSTTSGTKNSALGRYSGASNTSGSGNFFASYEAGKGCTTGSDNCFVGMNSGFTGTNNIVTGSNNILLGHDAQASGDVSNEVTIGDANITKFRLPGLDGFQIDDNGTIDLPGAIDENVYECTGTELDPDLGTVQYKTLAANTTLTESLTAGQSMLLMVDDGTAYTVTWPTMTWVGGSAPTLATSGYTCIELWKIASTLYGCHVGDVA